MKTRITSDPGLRLANGRRRWLIATVVIGLLLAIALALTEPAGAAPVNTQPAPPLPCTCSAGGRTWSCSIQFQQFGVKWLPVHACIPSQAQRIDGLAALLEGNKGGCGRDNRNMRYGLACAVSDAGRGFVSGRCTGGYWFSRVSTARTFDVGQPLTVDGCEGLKKELYAPIRISAR